MIKVPTIELYHPELGSEIMVQTEPQARLLEKKGWVRGKAPELKLGSSKPASSRTAPPIRIKDIPRDEGTPEE